MSLQRLYELDRSSARFPEQLGKLLDDKDWDRQLKQLTEREQMGLVDYLDKVRFIRHQPNVTHRPRRFLTVSNTTARPSGSVSVHYKGSVVPWRFSPRTMNYPAYFRSPARNRSPFEDSAASTKGHSVEQLSPSNGFGYPSWAIRGRSDG